MVIFIEYRQARKAYLKQSIKPVSNGIRPNSVAIHLDLVQSIDKTNAALVGPGKLFSDT